MVQIITLGLSEKQAEYLKDIMDFWMDDVSETQETLHQDLGINSVEMLTICADGISTQFREIKQLRHKLWEAMNSDSGNSRCNDSSSV